MDAKQLRIGNTVEYNLIGENVDKWIVTDVDEDDICDTSYLRPIPLTEEWLVKFGWGKSDEHELCDNSNEIVFVYDWHFKRLEIQIDTEHVGVEYKLDHIKHVHQLQNLYFALTDEELTTK